MVILAIAGTKPAASQIITGEVHATSQNQFNDNFQGLASGMRPAANTTRDDFLTTEIIGGAGNVEIGRQQLFARGDIGKTLHAKSTIFDSDLYTAAGGVNWKVTSACSGDATLTFDQHQSDITQLTVPVVNQSQAVSYGGTGLCNVGSGYWTGLDAKYLELTNSSQQQQTSNRNDTSVKGHFYYQRPSLTKLGVDIGYTESIFPQNFSLTVDRYDLSLVFVRQLDQKTFLTSLLGVSAVENYNNPAIPGSTNSTSFNPIVSVDLAYAATAKVNTDLLLSQIVQSSDQVVSTSVVVDTARLNATWQVSTKVSANETISYTISDFQSGTSTTGVLLQSGPSRLFSNIMSVNYSFSNHLSFNAQYVFNDQSSSTTANRSFTSNAIFFGFRVGY